MSDTLIWELVKNHNAFVKRNLNDTWFSAEPNNLLAKNSFKYSGIANSKAIGLTAGDGCVVLTKTKPTKGKGKPVNSKYSTTMKKDVRKMQKAVGAEVAAFRPDLKKASIARLSALHKSLRTIKAGPKK